MNLELSPGDKKDVSIQLRPRKRAIKMLQEAPSIQVTPPAIEMKDTLSSIPPTLRVCMITYHEKRKGFVLQISSWLTKTKANRVAKRADKIVGLKTFKEAADIPSLGRRYRVFIGVFNSREEAVDFCHQFDFEL
jgi:cell division septation protein DedD